MRVIEQIFRGGFGRVEKVEAPPFGVCAKKVFAPSPVVLAAGDTAKLLRRFEREVKVQSSLPSNFFLPVLAHDLAALPPWFLMPLAEKNFADRIKEAKTSGESLLDELADILNALEELHALGYTHRDLKPQNVLRHDSRWKLSDFGLVLPPSPPTTSFTSTNSSWCTQAYAAPEQALDFKHVSFQADIYSFGCILHDIFGGGAAARVPYRRQTCPGPLGHIIEKCTEDDPSKRFPNVSALRSALVMVLATPHDVPASPSAGEWQHHLSSVAEWNQTRIDEFLRFLSTAPAEDKRNIFPFIQEDQLEAIHSLSPELWHVVAHELCAWARGGFSFSFCDVLVRRLETLYELGDLEIKSAAVLAAAHLGASHNRWFVMARVVEMAGPQMEENVARRVAIDILASGESYNFIRCAQEIHRDCDAYHPKIAACLINPPPSKANTAHQ